MVNGVEPGTLLAVQWTLLQSLSDADQRAVIAACVRRKFRKGETVFHEADVGDTVHLLAHGHVAVRVSTPMGEIVTLSVLGPGASFGELALVGPDTARSATVVALDAVETLSLRRPDFVTLCAQQPGVKDLLVQLLAEQVRRLSNQVLEAMYVPADKRVVRRLRDLADLYADGTAGPVTIPVTQEDVATMAGTTRPTANRTLQELANEGIVDLGRGRTEVLDPAALAKRAR